MKRPELEAMLSQALPALRLVSFEPLPGGTRKRNFLLHFGPAHAPLVLRIASCEEIVVWRTAGSESLLPKLAYAGDDFLLYHYVQGVTFQQLKESGSRDDAAEAAFAIGRALASVRKLRVKPGTLAPRPLPESEHSEVLEQRIGGPLMAQWNEFLAQAMPQLRPLYAETSLVHGDFNNRNTILHRVDGRWEVAAILDWETAFLGSPLWDAARFICYEKDARPIREPHFSWGFQEGGGILPSDWRRVARVINAVGAMDALSRPDLPHAFVEDLRDLIAELLIHHVA